MSKVFKKNKGKRSRSSSSEASNSFVRNVTSRVSGLLPASITKWFSSPSSSSNANGSAQTADATDSSSEDESVDGPVILQPPSKRMRYSSPGSYNHYTLSETNCITSNVIVSDIEPQPYNAIQSPPGRTTFRRETNYRSTPLRTSEESIEIDDESEEKASTFTFKGQHSMSITGPSVTKKRKSLFDSSPASAEASLKACAQTANNQMKDSKAPYFKPALLGSSFYPGRTMYGGAASCYVNQPNIKQRKSIVVKETSSANNTISQSTRRILDLLENYSSPLNEAKRIPQYKRSPRNEGFNITLESAPPTKKVISYKTQELHVPSVATILRLRQKSRLMDTTTAARQILASHSSTAHLPYPVSSNKKDETTESETGGSSFTTKMKPRVTRQMRGDKDQVEALPEPVVLPSAVLQIDQNNLPKFSFGITPTPTPIISSTPIVPSARQPISTANQIPEYKSVIQVAETPKRKTDSVPDSNQFQFSSPVRISNEQPAIEDSLPKFTFGSPERRLDQTKETKEEIPSVIVSTETQKKLTAPKSKDWQCPDCWVSNKPDAEKCVCCGHQTASEASKKTEKCTICKLADSQPNANKCINCEKVTVNNVNNLSVNKAAESVKWKCEDCWVNNDETAEKCLCCGAGNPKTVVEKPTPTQEKSDSEWKCDDCWVKNKSDVNACIACGGARRGDRLGQKENVVTFFNTPLKVTNDLLKLPATPPPPPKWECPSCLVRNDTNKTKCVCCETDKPGTYSQAAEKAFNFGKNTSFKFGIPKNQDSNAKPEETNSTETKKLEETNNNVLSKTPSFTFGVPAKKTEDKVDSPKKSEESAPKINFSFGIPNSTSSVPAATPVFGIPSKPAETTPKVDEEKPQEVPKVDFSTPKADSPKPFANMFSPPPASQQPSEKVSFASSQDKSLVPNPLLNSTEVKKDGPSTTLSLPASTSVAAPQPTPSFSFGSGMGIKMTTNIFTAPAAATTAPITFGNVQTTTASTSSMFQKPETAPTTSGMLFSKNEAPISGSLFQKSDPPATASAPAPLFSFGNSAPAPQQEKPKFNFSLDSDIKLSFGGMSGGNSNSGNIGNALGGNGLAIGNGNGLSAGGIMGSNRLNTGISLGGNGLSSGSNLGGNGLSNNTSMPTNILGGSESNNPLAGVNNNVLQSPTSGIFGAPVQKDNAWPANNNIASNNIFGSNATSTSKPAFTFGASTPFNSNNTPTFGSPAQSPPNIFGMNQNSNSQGSLFGSQPSQPTGPVFGSTQPAAAPAPLSIFGTPNVGAAPTFGSPNPSIPTFEAPSLTPAPAPAFNFGAPQQTGVFGFGQQQQQQQPQQASGVYNFGAQGGGAPVVQFNMGSTPNMAVRRVRKAVRRTTPR